MLYANYASLGEKKKEMGRRDNIQRHNLCGFLENWADEGKAKKIGAQECTLGLRLSRAN